jgi:hypothetical protein
MVGEQTPGWVGRGTDNVGRHCHQARGWVNRGQAYSHEHMARVVHELPKVTPGLTMPYLSTTLVIKKHDL